MNNDVDTERAPLTRNDHNNINQTDKDASSIIDHKKIQRKKYIKRGIIGGIILIAVILIIVLPIVLTRKSDDDHHHDPDNPDVPQPPHGMGNPYKAAITNNTLASSIQGTLKVRSSDSNQDKSLFEQFINEDHVRQMLGKDSSSEDQTLAKQSTKSSSQNGDSVKIDWEDLKVDYNNQFAFNLNFSFDMVSDYIMRFNLTDADKPRYDVPAAFVNKPGVATDKRLSRVGFNYNLDPFSFSLSDYQDPSNVYVNTKGNTLTFMDKYIQMDFTLPSQRIFGFGERVHQFLLTEGTYTMWASGQMAPKDDGKGRKGLYGVHPFILVQSGKKKDDFFGIYFRNSNAQSPVLRFNDDGTSTLSYISIGGQIEAYFMMQGTPKEIIAQYHSVIGAPYLPPFWAMGWQQASWKYVDQPTAADALQQYAKNNLPLDTLYLDIPYMDGYKDFSINTTAFPKITDLADTLHKANQKLVLIVDGGISAEDPDNNEYYQQGNKDGIFIQSAINEDKIYGKNLVSKVWPDHAVFIDWFHEKCTNTWNKGLLDLYKKTTYDGLWLDMNEASTFSNGELGVEERAKIGKKEKKEEIVVQQRRILEAEYKDSNDIEWYYSLNGDIKISNDTYNLPFIVRNSEGDSGNWDNSSLSLNATHPGLNNASNMSGETEYNLHNLYGYMMGKRTRNFMIGDDDFEHTGNRHFILSRSTFPGSGRYNSHWLGDNWKDWDYMKLSIAGIMNMNMFGVGHSGADVCGFFGEKRDDEMCVRWIQLATFYPLARFHQNLTWNGGESDRREPFTLTGQNLEDARKAMFDRYAYLRLVYTCMFQIYMNGGSCFDPLFYHYPQDEETYKDIESTFMVADSVKVSPILQAGVTDTFKSYFPQGIWVNVADLSEVIDASAKGDYFDLKVRPTVNAHLKQGTLIPYQATDDQKIKTTADLLQRPISIIANRDSNGHAEGMVFLDQGISRQEIDDWHLENYLVTLQQKSFHLVLKNGWFGYQPHILDKFVVANAKDLKGTNFACAYDFNMNKLNMIINFNNAQNSLELKFDSPTPLKFSQVSHVYFGNTDLKDVNYCDDNLASYKIKDGKQPDLSGNSTTIVLAGKNPNQPDLQANIKFISANIINVKWNYVLDAQGNPPAGKRMPVEVPDEFINTTAVGGSNQKLSDYIQVTVDPFQVKFMPRNKIDTNPYFVIKGMYLDSYSNWIKTQVKVPAGATNFKGIFGLGERALKSFFYESGVYTLWGKDQGTPDEDGRPPAKSMYGTHPFYMFRHDTKSYAGVFTKLAHAQDWYINNNKDKGLIDILSIATGGLGDISVMVDQQQPEDIIERYYSMIGDPVLIPQWSLGWNQCKWGYTSTQDLRDSVANYTKFNLPLDVQWSDIDYMDNYKDFTYDTNRFKGLPDFIDDLHKDGRHFVPIVDAGVAMRPDQDYSAYQTGVDQDVFLKINTAQNGTQNFIGSVWPNEALFPDFYAKNTVQWWHDQLTNMHDIIKFDGLWEDMNEVSNFCTGLCKQNQVPKQQLKNMLPYIPSGADLEDHTASLDVQHANGYYQLDTHSYWGTQEVKATHEWFRDVQKTRTFIIERSSFAGMGKYGSRWLGDNSAKESQMGYSVTGVMLMNMFGIQMAGSDICGFNDNTNPELCARWHVVGSFYPFSRNHNSIGMNPQEPWNFPGLYEDGVTFMSIMQDAINNKYSMIRYYYTNLFLASQGSTQAFRKAFYKPVFFAFPEDLNTYDDLMHNVMLGDALKLSVNSDTLKQNTTSYYFPAGTWCDIFHPLSKCMVSKGEAFSMPSKAYDFSVHLREGYVVPMQDAKALKITKSSDLQSHPVDFHVLGTLQNPPKKNWIASGDYINDDGVTLDLTNTWNRYIISLTGAYSDKELITMKINMPVQSKFVSKDDPKCNTINQNDNLGQIFIYNAASFKTANTYDVKGVVSDTVKDPIGQAVYDDKTDRLVFTAQKDLQICLSKYQIITFEPTA